MSSSRYPPASRFQPSYTAKTRWYPNATPCISPQIQGGSPRSYDGARSAAASPRSTLDVVGIIRSTINQIVCLK